MDLQGAVAGARAEVTGRVSDTPGVGGRGVPGDRPVDLSLSLSGLTENLVAAL